MSTPFLSCSWLRPSVTASLVLTCLCSTSLLPVAAAPQWENRTTVAASPTDASYQLYVDPSNGSDAATSGTTTTTAYRSITYALKQAQPGTIIYLAPGQYTDATETFPLQVPAGVTLSGNAANQGESTKIQGSGEFVSSWWGRQNVTITVANNSHLVGVSVTNPDSRGTGVWIESSNATVRNCTFTDSLREGVFVAGNANPMIENNRFEANSANGLSITGKAKGTIRGNMFKNTGFGIAIGDQSRPAIINNQIEGNVDGVVVSHHAQPILRGNKITNNQRDGVVAITHASPNLGDAGNPGGNTFADNGRYAIYNATKGGVIAASGNQIAGDSQLTPAAANPKPAPVSTQPAAELPVLNKVQPIATPVPTGAAETTPTTASTPAELIDMQDLKQRVQSAPTITYKGKTYILKDSVLDSPN